MRPDCDDSSKCTKNCCISLYAAPPFFISFVLFAQFVLVNIVIAVLMKHLRVTKLCKGNLNSRKNSVRGKPSAREDAKQEPERKALTKWQKAAEKRKGEKEILDEKKNYVLTKRSTDDINGVQLRQYRMHLEERSDKNPEDSANNNVKVLDENSLEKDQQIKNEQIGLKNEQAVINPELQSDSFEAKCEPDKEDDSVTIESMPNGIIVQDEVSQDVSQEAEHLTENESRDISIEIPEFDENQYDYCCCCKDENIIDIELNEMNKPFDSSYNGMDGNGDSEMLTDLSHKYSNEDFCQYEDRVSFTGSPVLNIPDDFYSEDETTPLKSKLCEVNPEADNNRDDVSIGKTGKKNDVESRIQSTFGRSESTDTYSSFEILPECLELCEISENTNGSNESFALVDSDNATSKVLNV